MRGIRYCSTGVTVTGLARPGRVVEIDALAVVPDTARRTATTSHGR